MISKETLSKQFISSRDLNSENDMELLYEAIDLFTEQFSYDDLDIFLSGFNDSPNMEGAIDALQYTLLDKLLPTNPSACIEAFLTKYPAMLPHAKNWFSSLLCLFLIIDDGSRWLTFKETVEKGVGKGDEYLKTVMIEQINMIQSKIDENPKSKFNQTELQVAERLRYLVNLLDNQA